MRYARTRRAIPAFAALVLLVLAAPMFAADGAEQGRLARALRRLKALMASAEKTLARVRLEAGELKKSHVQNGTVHHFQPKNASKPDARNTRRTVLYINGIWTKLDKFRRNAQGLADTIGRPVTAVYAGGWTRGTESGAVMLLNRWTKLGKPKELPEGQALLKLLARAEKEKKKVDLVCHSRGTMIAHETLQGHAWVGDNVTVYAFACVVADAFPVKSYYKVVNEDDHLARFLQLVWLISRKPGPPEYVKIAAALSNSDRVARLLQVAEKDRITGRSGGHAFADYVANLKQGNYSRHLPLAPRPRPAERKATE